mgnify:CR=1 FL=1
MSTWLDFTTLSAAASSTLPILSDAALKSLGILMPAAVATATMRRSSAAARHLVWFLAVASLLVLPILSGVLPAWRILPHWADPVPALVFAPAPATTEPPATTIAATGTSSTTPDTPAQFVKPAEPIVIP